MRQHEGRVKVSDAVLHRSPASPRLDRNGYPSGLSQARLALARVMRSQAIPEMITSSGIAPGSLSKYICLTISRTPIAVIRIASRL